MIEPITMAVTTPGNSAQELLQPLPPGRQVP
jgi:hypothetical protein